MVRRFDQVYRVKPRDNLGDPDYWNLRFDDIDRRVSSNEDGLDAIGGLTAYVEGLALDRLNLVLAPALDKVALVSEQGFLLAHSISTVTLDVDTTQTFAIENAAERDLFAPSPFVTIEREANNTDYAFAKTVSWDRVSGQLVLQPIQIFGNPGPFTDWVIYVGTALPQTVSQMLTDTEAARDAAKGYRDTSGTNAAATASDKAAVTLMKSDALAARDAAAVSAAAAAQFDPSSFIAKNSTGTYSQTITFSMSPLVPTAVAGDNSQNAASTAFVKNAISALVNGAGASLDTLQELAAALGNDANYSATVTAALGNRLRVDTNAQGLTAAQQLNARTNLGFPANTVGLVNIASAAQIAVGVAGDAITINQAWAAAGWVNLGNLTGTVTIDGNTGCKFFGLLTGNVTFAFTNLKNGQTIDLIVQQDATGGRTVSWSGVNFPDGTAPTISTTANYIAVCFSGEWTPWGWLTGAGWKIN